MKYFYVLLALALSACTTADINATKQLTITPQPEDKVVIVQADAHTVCKDYVFFQRCWLTVDSKQVK